MTGTDVESFPANSAMLRVISATTLTTSAAVHHSGMDALQS
jgi:hypothetical protein